MVEDCALWINHSGGGVDNFDGSEYGNVTFGNIYGEIERTEGEF